MGVQKCDYKQVSKIAFFLYADIAQTRTVAFSFSIRVFDNLQRFIYVEKIIHRVFVFVVIFIVHSVNNQLNHIIKHFFYENRFI